MGKGNTNYGRTVGGATSAPWSPQQPYIQQGFQEAASQLNGPSTVAGFSPQTQAGLGMTQQIAGSQTLPQSSASFLESMLGGSGLSPTAWMGGGTATPSTGTITPGTSSTSAPTSRPTRPSMAGLSMDQRQAARAQFRNDLEAWRTAGRPRGAGAGGGSSGGGMFQNQYIDQLASSIGNKVVPGVMSNFAGMGRTGSSPLAQTAVASGIADSLAPYMFGSAENQMGRMFSGYQNERDRQMQALGLSPSIAASQYGPANAMLGAGAAYDQLAQAQLSEPSQKLSNYMNIVGLPFGNQTTSDFTAPTSQDKPLGVGNVLTK